MPDSPSTVVFPSQAKTRKRSREETRRLLVFRTERERGDEPRSRSSSRDQLLPAQQRFEECCRDVSTVYQGEVGAAAAPAQTNPFRGSTRGGQQGMSKIMYRPHLKARAPALALLALAALAFAPGAVQASFTYGFPTNVTNPTNTAATNMVNANITVEVSSVGGTGPNGGNLVAFTFRNAAGASNTSNITE